MDWPTVALALLVWCTAVLAEQVPGPAALRRATLDAAAGTFHIRDGRDFAAAFADPGTTQLVILNSIILSDEVGACRCVTELIQCISQPPHLQPTPQLVNTLKCNAHIPHIASIGISNAQELRERQHVSLTLTPLVHACFPAPCMPPPRTGAPTPSQSALTATSP